MRENLLRGAGLECVTATGPGLRDPRGLAERLRCGRAPGSERSRGWTLRAPEGWWCTDTAADRLARRDWLRSQGVPA